MFPPKHTDKHGILRALLIFQGFFIQIYTNQGKVNELNKIPLLSFPIPNAMDNIGNKKIWD